MSSFRLSTLPPMIASDPSPQHGYRRPPTFSELPLVTVLVAAALVLVVGLRGGSSASDSDGVHASTRAGEIDRQLAMADRASGTASGMDGESLAPVGPAAERIDLAATAERDSGGALDAVRTAANPGDGPGTVDTGPVDLHDRNGLPCGLRERGSFHRGVRHGDWMVLHEGGAVRERGAYVDGQRDGLWETFSTTGMLMLEEDYSADLKHGDWRMYANSGALIGEGTNQQNEPNGRWTLWYSDGSIKERGRYEDGLREGTWEFYDDLGQPTVRSGMYRAGIRIN